MFSLTGSGFSLTGSGFSLTGSGFSLTGSGFSLTGSGSSLTRRTLLGAAAMSAFAADYRILDPHVHVWKHDPKFPFSPGQRVPDRDATPEMLLELMKANGVARTVLIQYIGYRW